MHETTMIENEQRKKYPGLSIQREGDAVVVHIPAKFHKFAGSRVLITPDGRRRDAKDRDKTVDENANAKLVKAIAMAYRWQEQIESGEFAGIDELAEAKKVDRTYIGRLLRLTSLAPDIVEAILRGEEPDGLSLRQLQKDVPQRWEDQRQRWPCRT